MSAPVVVVPQSGGTVEKAFSKDGLLPCKPQGGTIAARPRREGLYDCEQYLATGFGGSATRYPFFQSTSRFQQPDSLFLTKQFGIDTNLVGNGGQLPKGHYLRVFGLQSYVAFRFGALTPLTAARLDDVRQIYDTAFVTIQLGSTPYMSIPFYRVPAGTGISGTVSTTQVLTAGNVTMGVPINTCYFDLTTPTKIRCSRPVESVVIPVGNGKSAEIAVRGGVPTTESLANAFVAAGAKDDVGQARIAAAADQAIRRASVLERHVPRTPIEFAETESFSVNLNYPTRPALSGTSLPFIYMNLVSIYLKPLAA